MITITAIGIYLSCLLAALVLFPFIVLFGVGMIIGKILVLILQLIANTIDNLYDWITYKNNHKS